MTEPEASQAIDALRAGLRQITAAVTRAHYLAEQADVDGEPGLATVLRAMAERNEGLAQGLYALLAEETDTADARPGADDLAARLPVEAAMYTSLADEIRDHARPDLAAWMDKMAAAQHDHQRRLDEARHWSDPGGQP
jgi:rubrerythrin